jgi:hypothetical protein
MREILTGGILVVLLLSFLRSCAETQVEQQRYEEVKRVEVYKDMSKFWSEVYRTWNSIQGPNVVAYNVGRVLGNCDLGG